jgi:DNA mismatch repair protein MutS2
LIYPENFEDKIGFSRIRELIAEHCLFDPGRERVASMRMLDDYERVALELDRVEEFRRIELSNEDFPVHQFHDNRESLRKATIEGTHLEVDEVAGLARSLESVRLIVKFFEGDRKEEYPRLKELSGRVKLFPYVTERIQKILNKHFRIRDNASPDLTRIRRDITVKQSSVSKQLQRILKKAQSEGWVEEDAAATFRNGRPVIPVSASYKRSMGGLVHDESATGKTAYIEPAEVVELTNEIRELEYAERREVLKILTVFTDDIRPYVPELLQLGDFLAEIDFVRARALFAKRIHGIRPQLKPEQTIDWVNAVHPLLFLALQQHDREVVPLTIRLDAVQRILLISGPNAGGKSVCLQTVGLLQYMCQCGLLVPADEASKFGLFSGIFIDIGDEQSIDNDLSTYSSHLMNMKHFVRHAASDTLCLIDEFGTGTEPMLGGAIAEAILETLNGSGTFGVLTTHYTNLKHFAASTDGIINGAMLFDNHRMQPLYELQVGKPGSSFAFEIARKIGLPEDVLQRAGEKVGQDHIDFDKHLKDVLRDKKYWERKRQKIRQSEKKLEELMGRYEEELNTSEKKRKALINEAKEKAERILAEANRAIENTIREIKESNAEKERTRQARKKLEQFQQDLGEEEKIENDKLSQEYAALKKKEEELGHRRPDIRKRTQQKRPVKTDQPADLNIRQGDMVRIRGQELPGEVVEVRGKNVTVAFGNLKTTTKLDQLEKLTSDEAESNRIEPAARNNLGDWEISRRRASFRPQLDVRGKRAEEALQMVSDFMDEAIMVGVAELSILHGKGDGVLRQVIREYLESTQLADWYGDEHVERGGAGITLVRLDT